MARRFPVSLVLTAATLFFLWAPLLQLGARSVILATQNPSLWRELPVTAASRGVLFGTLELCVLSAILATILGIPLGFCLARGPKWLRVFAAIGCALPLGVPPVIVAAPFTSARGAVDYPLFYAVLTLAMSFYPIVALSCGVAIASLPRGEEEAALLASGPLRAWFGVLGRRLFPAILGGAGAVAALCAWEMGAPDLLSQPSFGMNTYRALNSPQMLAPGESGARAFIAALPVPFLALLFLIPTLRAMRDFGISISNQNAAPTSRFAAFGAFVLLVSPGFILFQLLTSLESKTAIFTTISANEDALRNTLIAATLAAATMTLGALFLLFSWRNWPKIGRNFALSAALLPGLCAPVVLAVALIEWWNRDTFAAIYDSTLGMVLIGYAARFFPFALALLWAPVSRFDAEMLFASQNVGASPLRTLFSIQIPLLKGPLAATFAVLWALCAGELTISVLVHGPGGDTLPLPIFNLLHAGLAADVAALCLLLMSLCGTAMSLALVFLRPKL
ncbi:MAG TPA: hypothetical protein VF627_11720 [Abditibacterium sp.]